MIAIASDWLGLALLLATFSWFAKRRIIALFLPFAAIIAAFAVWVPTGSPRLTHVPPGDYTVLGAKIEVNVAIWVLLDDNKNSSEPRYYRLAYTNEAAGQLQQALDGAQGGSGGVRVKIDGGGGQSYSGDPPVQGDAPKTPEQPAIQIP